LADRLAIMRAGKIVQIGRPADIVLNPADDYVAQFTEDMPLLRVITAGDIATPANGAALPERSVAAGTSLETLLPQLASGVAAFSIQSAGDAPPALLSASAVLAVLEREQARRTRS
ncbi:MAG: glycine betaine/L-proline ABC transporter ATP-binding protein, partial [Mesorhizobium sp.]|nr:glycine betaine/L-proline ABC transporter ATP-binding protein [Mesorhizobium sp.]